MFSTKTDITKIDKTAIFFLKPNNNKDFVLKLSDFLWEKYAITSRISSPEDDITYIKLFIKEKTVIVCLDSPCGRECADNPDCALKHNYKLPIISLKSEESLEHCLDKITHQLGI